MHLFLLLLYVKYDEFVDVTDDDDADALFLFFLFSYWKIHNRFPYVM